jgi:DNA replication protein DnaC
MFNDILKRLNELRLYGVAETLAVRIESAYKSKSTYEELLLSILDDQYEYQDNKALSRRIKSAKFEEYKSFDGYETMRYSMEVNSIINELKTGKFLNNKNHVIVMGPVGTGKTHLSQALGLFISLPTRKESMFYTSK